MKLRVEKKIVHRHMDECEYHQHLYKHETRLESSRRRRIASINRRQTRRLYRQSPFVRWLYKEIQAKLTVEWQAAMYAEMSSSLFSGPIKMLDVETFGLYEDFAGLNTPGMTIYTEGSDERIQEG